MVEADLERAEERAELGEKYVWICCFNCVCCSEMCFYCRCCCFSAHWITSINWSKYRWCSFIQITIFFKCLNPLQPYNKSNQALFYCSKYFSGSIHGYEEDNRQFLMSNNNNLIANNNFCYILKFANYTLLIQKCLKQIKKLVNYSFYSLRILTIKVFEFCFCFLFETN